MIKMHPSITPERVLEAAEHHQTDLDDPGFCLTCGVDVFGIEPDARRYVCEACGCHTVYGAEEVLLMME